MLTAKLLEAGFNSLDLIESYKPLLAYSMCLWKISALSTLNHLSYNLSTGLFTSLYFFTRIKPLIPGR